MWQKWVYGATGELSNKISGWLFASIGALNLMEADVDGSVSA